MPYAHTSRGTLKSLVTTRMSDPSKVFWVDDEINRAIDEALRMFNVLTGQNHARVTFPLTASTSFYELHTQAQTAPYVAPSVTDQALITEIQYHLLEPPSPAVWTGTDLWTLAEVTDALERRRDRFLQESATVIARDASIVLADPPGSRLTLPTATLDVRRAVYKTPTGTYHPLTRSSEFNTQGLIPGWNTQAQIPRSYSLLTGGALELQFLPPPADTGTMDFLFISKGATLLPSAGATVLGVPDDVAFGVKYGTLADLLSKDGPAADPARSEIYEAQYQLAVTLAQNLPLVLDFELNGRTIFPDVISYLDLMDPSWQGKRSGTPSKILIAGRNLLAVTPAPRTSNADSITVDLVRNAELPTTDGSFLQIPVEHVPTLLDFTEAILMSKMGALEARLSALVVARAMRAVLRHNRSIARFGQQQIMAKISRLEEIANPTQSVDLDGTGALTGDVLAAQQFSGQGGGGNGSQGGGG